MTGSGPNNPTSQINAMRTSVNKSNNDISSLFAVESIMMTGHGNGMPFMTH